MTVPRIWLNTKNERKYFSCTPQTPRWTWSSVAANTSTIEITSRNTVSRIDVKMRSGFLLGDSIVLQGACTVLRNERNAGLACATAAAGPVSLKNHVPPSHGTDAATTGLGPSEASSTTKCSPLLSNDVVTRARPASSTGSSPAWPRQRFTLASTPPTSPGKAVT